MTENTIRHAVRTILTEKQKASSEKITHRGGRGRYKKAITQQGALAKDNPQELMKRLKISKVNEREDIKRLNSLFLQAVSGVIAMQGVYGEPSPRKDKQSGLQGIRIPVKLIPPRDARKYMEHTLVGAEGAGTVKFDNELQVEILGNDILIYFSSKPYSWGRAAKTKKKKATTPQKSPTQAKATTPPKDTA